MASEFEKGERRALATRLSVVARLVVPTVLASCGVLHVGRMSSEGTAALESVRKPPPVDSEFEGCGPAGSQPDYALNRLKNRIDEPLHGRYLPLPWTAIARLPYPTWAVFRFRNQWTHGERREVSRYEGAAIEIEGYLSGYRLEIPEPPNCYSWDARHKDFHLWLSRVPGESPDKSIVVELTPRVRTHHPAWTTEHLQALQALQVPLRVRGWLMLDQMHPEKIDRNRRTLWEVHPVMQLDWRRGDGTWISLDSLPPAGIGS